MTHVTAVMITGKDPGRISLARLAVQAFQEQTYPEKSLRIINTGPTPILTEELAGVTEQHIPKMSHHTLGALRNLAHTKIQDGRIVQWDDDDWSNPERITWQLQNTPAGIASIFRREIICDLGSGEAFDCSGMASRVNGFAGTMMYPANTLNRFPTKAKEEDTEFLLKFLSEARLRVLENNPTLYIRFYHGLNTWDRKHVMRRRPGWRELTNEQRQYLDIVMSRYQDVLPGSARS